LRSADDAIRIDSTAMDVDTVVRLMLAEVAKRLEQDKS
jgi:cytidylate kinase